MTHTKSNTGVGGQIIHKFEDFADDFPDNGVAVSDASVVYIDNGSGDSVRVDVTFDNQQDIASEENVTWSEGYVNVSDGEKEMIVFDPGPTGVRIVAEANGAFGWIRT